MLESGNLRRSVLWHCELSSFDNVDRLLLFIVSIGSEHLVTTYISRRSSVGRLENPNCSVEGRQRAYMRDVQENAGLQMTDSLFLFSATRIRTDSGGLRVANGTDIR